MTQVEQVGVGSHFYDTFVRMQFAYRLEYDRSVVGWGGGAGVIARSVKHSKRACSRGLSLPKNTSLYSYLYIPHTARYFTLLTTDNSVVSYLSQCYTVAIAFCE